MAEVYTVQKSSLDAVADAIREKNGKSDALSFPEDFVHEIDNLNPPEDVWVKPADWPDIEALPLPDGNESCMYFLYDCRTEVRWGMFTHTYYKGHLSIAKCTDGVIGEFDDSEEVQLSSSVHAIPLPDDCDWAVLRLAGEYGQWCFSRNLDYGLHFISNNNGSNQPCVWMYGKVWASAQLDLYQNQTAGINTLMLKRARLYLHNITIGYGFGYIPAESILINDGDMKGDIFPLNSTAASVFMHGNFALKNGHITRTSTTKLFGGLRCKSVDFTGLTWEDGFVMNIQQIAQSCEMLERYIMPTNGMKISTMYYSFTGCRMLKTVNLTGCDLSECTNVTACFPGCYNLQELWLGDGLKLSLDISSCHCLSHDSLVDGVIKRLGTVDTTQTLNLADAALERLTPEEIAIATQKGWTVT